MKVVQNVTWEDVQNHWSRTESWPTPDARSAITSLLPTGTSWHLCQIELEDLERLYIISSDNWTGVSTGTFQVTAVASHVASMQGASAVDPIARKILGQVAHLDADGELPSGLVAVTDDPTLNGRFTFIEGNHRAVACLRAGILVGASIFVGVSPLMGAYHWARHTYR